MMTQKEAIEYFESLLKRFEEMYETETSYWGKAHAETTIEATRMALSALLPVSREQVEKVWRGEWEDMREAYNDVPKRRCSRCKSVFIGLDTPFCEVCGAPMTDEAVDMVMERMDELQNEIG